MLPSQKPGTYKTAIAVNKTNGQILYGSYTCVAGSSAYNHTAALMFAVDDMNRPHAIHGSSAGPSSTSLPRKWGVPPKPRKDPAPVNKLEIAMPKYGMVQQHTHPTDIQPIDPMLGIVDITRVMSLREDLRKNCKDYIFFTQVWPSNPDNK